MIEKRAPFVFSILGWIAPHHRVLRCLAPRPEQRVSGVQSHGHGNSGVIRAHLSVGCRRRRRRFGWPFASATVGAPQYDRADSFRKAHSAVAIAVKAIIGRARRRDQGLGSSIRGGPRLQNARPGLQIHTRILIQNTWACNFGSRVCVFVLNARV